MTTLALTKKAFASLYGAPTTILVGAASWAKLAAEVPSDIEVLCLHSDGVISEGKAGPKRQQGELLAPIGLPVGLIAVVTSGAEAAAAALVIDYAKSQKMYRTPDIVNVSSWSRGAVHQLRAYLINFLASSAQNTADQLAFREKALAQLRRENETLHLAVEKMRRLVTGAGFDTRTIAVDIPHAKNRLGPSGDEQAHSYRQRLPCDVIGLAGIALYFGPATSDEGNVLIRVIRAADNQPLVTAIAPYSDLTEAGWYNFYFDNVVTGTFGAADLEITWQGSSDDAAPSVHFGNVDADRFGDEHGRTLALQVFRGVGDPLTDEGGNILSALVPLRCPVSEMAKTLQPLFNDQAEVGSDGPVTIDLSGGWVQTHLVENGISGVRLSSVVPVGTKSIEIDTCTAHQLAPAVCYFMALTPSGDQEGLSSVLSNLAKQAVMAAEESMPLSGEAGGTFWVAGVNRPMDTNSLRLELAEETNGESDLFLIAVSRTGKADYGWCRWQGLRFGLATKPCEAASTMPVEYRAAPEKRLSVKRFTDLANRATFVGGARSLQELTDRLGFSPFILNDDDGSLQTHPLLDQVSAVFVRDAVHRFASCVRSQVGTAHAGAPEFLYLMIVLEDRAADRQKILSDLVPTIDLEDQATLSGHDRTKGIHWIARRVRAGSRASMEINFEKELGENADAIFATLPVSNSISFGWCRWYWFTVISALPDAGRR